MPALPTGTVTFLFTDIEGSTKLWEEHPEEMRVALARHDDLMRKAIEQHDGHVFKTVGDAFCAAFHTAPTALQAALSAQQALLQQAETWRDGVIIKVRMALHTGAAEVRNNDYFGQPLNRVARLLATGHGGQTLLTTVAYGLCRDTLPPSVRLTSLGEHRLRDLHRPETIFQLLHPALPSQFPPLRTLDNPALPNNLPQQLTSFIGREKDLAELTTLLTRSRLLTLVGAGGIGKTRLALQFAANTLEQFPDGVFLVELAALADPTLVPQTVAQVLGIQDQSGRSLQQTLIDHLDNKRMLLLLDNCEHLIAACAQLISALLRACPTIVALATSREVLGIGGEQIYRIPSLSLPDPGQSYSHPDSLESLSQYEAVRLFIERAHAVRSDFTVTHVNAPALAQVCYRLDGIPMAIELAAARVRSLSVEEIHSRLDNRFRLLTGGDRMALPRQQTLRALIDWSYDLLDAQEKGLLIRLSVFVGGWTLAAAETVCAGESVTGETIEEWEVMDLLTGLVDKSLVTAEEQAGMARFHLLETVRQYAVEKLAESAEAAAMRDRHCHWYRALVEAAEPLLSGPDQALWLKRLASEHDNLRAALTWLEANDPQSGLQVAGLLWRFWEIRGYAQEGRARLRTLLQRGESDPPTAYRAQAHHAAGALSASLGDYPQALHHYEQSRQIAQTLGDLYYVALAKQQCALAAQEMGDVTSAVGLLEEATALYREQGKHDMVADNQSNLAVMAMEQGDYSRAQDLLTEALRFQRDRGDLRSIAITLNNLGDVARNQGDYARARACQAESLHITSEIGAKRGSAYALEAFADIAVDEAQWERAVYFWGAAQNLRETNGCPLTPSERASFETLTLQVKTHLPEARFAVQWNAGLAAPFDQAVAVALADVVE